MMIISCQQMPQMAFRILQGIEKVAKAMLLNRVPDNQIIAYTGLTQEQLNSLKD